MKRFYARNPETARRLDLAIGARLLFMLFVVGTAGCSRFSSTSLAELAREGDTASAARETSGPIWTDKTEYTLSRWYRSEERLALAPARGRDTVQVLTRSALVVIATYRNDSPAPVFVGYCGGRPPLFHLEKRVGDSWILAYRPVCNALGHEEPFRVEPGGSYTDTIIADHLEPPIEGPRFRVDSIPGQYRLVYELYSTWTPPGRGELLPLETRTSNEFLIRSEK